MSHLLKEFPVCIRIKIVEILSFISLINEICFILYFANLFKDLKLYYLSTHIHDWRGCPIVIHYIFILNIFEKDYLYFIVIKKDV